MANEHLKSLWGKGRPFQEAIEPINGVLGIKAKLSAHSIYGENVSWRIKAGRFTVAHAQVFTVSNVLRLGLPNESEGFAYRTYSLDAVYSDEVDAQVLIRMYTSVPGQNSLINVYRDGNTEERHRFSAQNPIFHDLQGLAIRPTSASAALPNLELPFSTAVSVEIAAQELGCTETYVRQLARSGKLSAQKIGRDWSIDAEALAEYPRPRSWTQKH